MNHPLHSIRGSCYGPNLTLVYSGGGYELAVPGMGSIALLTNPQNEAQAVQVLAQAMQQGPAQVVADAEFIFPNADQINLEVVDDIFAGTHQLLFGAESIFTCDAGETLLDVLQDVGDALAAFFP